MKVVITYKYEPDDSCLEIFVEKELVSTWYCEEDPEEAVKGFADIFSLGLSYGYDKVTEIEIKNPDIAK